MQALQTVVPLLQRVQDELAKQHGLAVRKLRPGWRAVDGDKNIRPLWGSSAVRAMQWCRPRRWLKATTSE